MFGLFFSIVILVELVRLFYCVWWVFYFSRGIRSTGATLHFTFIIIIILQIQWTSISHWLPKLPSSVSVACCYSTEYTMWVQRHDYTKNKWTLHNHKLVVVNKNAIYLVSSWFVRGLKIYKPIILNRLFRFRRALLEMPVISQLTKKSPPISHGIWSFIVEFIRVNSWFPSSPVHIHVFHHPKYLY
jgi:hypothetical protein